MTRSSVHNIFDEVFLVNLPWEKEKLISVLSHLSSFSIFPRIWEATNGYSNPYLTSFLNYYQKALGNMHFQDYAYRELKRGEHLIESPGSWGYINTMLSILEYSKNHRLKKILILEDDIILDRKFEEKFCELISKVDDWKVLNLGCSQHKWDSVDLKNAKSKGFYFPSIIETTGSFAMGIDIGVFDAIIEKQSYFDAPFDNIPMGLIYEKYEGKCFVFYPNIVIPDVTESNIREARNQAVHAKKVKWPLENFEYPRTPFRCSIICTSIEQLDHCYFEKNNNDLIINWLFYDGEFKPVNTKADVKYLKKTASEIQPKEKRISYLANTIGLEKVLILARDRVYQLTEIQENIVRFLQGSELKNGIFSVKMESAETNPEKHTGVSFLRKSIRKTIKQIKAFKRSCSSVVVITNFPEWSFKYKTTESALSKSGVNCVLLSTFGKPLSFTLNEYFFSEGKMSNLLLAGNSLSTLSKNGIDPNLNKHNNSGLLKIDRNWLLVNNGFKESF